MMPTRMVHDPLEDIKEERGVECKRQVQLYQKMFSVIPTMTSTELVSNYYLNRNSSLHGNLILIDVRTEAEYAVSMIPGAITLKEFEHQQTIKHHHQNDDNVNHHANSNSRSDNIIVTYCTVGYRSGREALRLQDKYPQYNGTIYNLDGILSYTYVKDAPTLVTPSPTSSGSSTTTTTNKIHTYGQVWGNLVNPTSEYEAIWFLPKNYAFHLIQTVGVSIQRCIQHIIINLSSFVGWYQHRRETTITTKITSKNR
jgi:rhodanese-related sulfurtransferase